MAKTSPKKASSKKSTSKQAKPAPKASKAAKPGKLAKKTTAPKKAAQAKSTTKSKAVKKTTKPAKATTKTKITRPAPIPQQPAPTGKAGGRKISGNPGPGPQLALSKTNKTKPIVSKQMGKDEPTDKQPKAPPMKKVSPAVPSVVNGTAGKTLKAAKPKKLKPGSPPPPPMTGKPSLGQPALLPAGGASKNVPIGSRLIASNSAPAAAIDGDKPRGGKKNAAGLSTKDLEEFRQALLHKRAELVGDVSSMEREALRERGNDLSNLPVHMADQGTDAYEQEFTLGLVEKDRQLLREIQEALGRIANGTYGICEGTQQPINRSRLEAKPWARYTVEYAREMEKKSGKY